MFELIQLLYFVTIVEQGTVSKAAEYLLVSQPALTRSLQKLEDELEIKLFERKKNKITINENGQLAYQYAKKILEMATDMKTDLISFDRSKRTISIGSLAPAPIWGLKYLFQHKYPEIKIEEDLQNNADYLLNGLKHDQYNIIVLHYPVDDPHLQSIELFDEQLYLSLPPAHPLALFDKVSFDDLNGESILLLSRIGFWNEICLQHIPDSHLLIQSDENVFNEIKRASALPNFKTNISMQRNQDQNRVAIPITDQEAKLTFYAIYKKENKKLFEFLKNHPEIDWKNT